MVMAKEEMNAILELESGIEHLRKAATELESAIASLREAAGGLHHGYFEVGRVARTLEPHLTTLKDHFVIQFYEEPITPYIAYKEKVLCRQA